MFKSRQLRESITENWMNSYGLGQVAEEAEERIIEERSRRSRMEERKRED